MILRAVYAGATSLAGPCLRLMLRRRVARGKEIATRVEERRGIDTTPRPSGKLLWLHAASVGEATSVLPVLVEFARLAPKASILMTTGTVTSSAMLAMRLPELGLEERVTHRFVPLDVPAWAGRFLDHWRPDAAAFVESEIWPNLLIACRRRKVPTMLLNGRLSERSFKGWRRWPGLAARLFGGFDRVLAQSGPDAERLRALGAVEVEESGNLKFAAVPLPVSRIELERLRREIGARPIWLAASTHPGEEAAVIACHAALAPKHPGLLTIIAPRHPDRGAEIARQAAPFPVTRRSQRADPPALVTPELGGVYVADTIGELGLFYALAGFAFVGGSLVPHGGQNPLEPARLGCASAVGPHSFNFRDAIVALEAAGALSVVNDPAGLIAWVDEMLGDAARRRTMGDAGILAARRHAELPQRVAAILAELTARPRP